jgi:hypothetical protein
MGTLLKIKYQSENVWGIKAHNHSGVAQETMTGGESWDI